MIKFLIVGFGKAGKRHFSNIKKLKDVKEIAILETKRNKWELEKLKNLKIIKNKKEIKNYKPDVVIISSPATYHLKQANFFCDLKSSLIIEKPLSIDYYGIKKLNRKIIKNSVFCLVGYNLIFLPSLIKFKQLLYSQKYGIPYKFEIIHETFMPSWRKKNYKKVVSSQKKLGGGILLELSHEFHYAYWILKNFKFVSGFVDKISNYDTDVEDFCDLNFIVDNKSFTKCILNIKIDFFSKNNQRKIIVYTNKGILSWDYLLKNVIFYKFNGRKKILYNQIENNDTSYTNQLSFFLKNYKNNKVGIYDFDINYNVLKLINNIKKL